VRFPEKKQIRISHSRPEGNPGILGDKAFTIGKKKDRYGARLSLDKGEKKREGYSPTLIDLKGEVSEG